MASTRTNVKPTTTDGSHTATADRLSADELHNLDAYWRAGNYLAAGMN
jgi:phosphoketolase